MGDGAGRRRRSVQIQDLMMLVVAVASTLIAPRIMNGIIPDRSLANWDRRQYAHHVGSLVLLGWSASSACLLLAEVVRLGRRSCRGYAMAGMIAIAASGLFLLARQIPVMITLAWTGAGARQIAGIVRTRLFDILQLAPTTNAAAISVLPLVFSPDGRFLAELNHAREVKASVKSPTAVGGRSTGGGG